MNNKTLLTIILMVVVFGVGFMLGRMTSSSGAIFTGNSNDTANEVGQSDGKQDNLEGTGEGATTINSSNMTEGQRKFISALGLDPNNVTVTAEMIACAEEKLGAARVEEIKNGATPSLIEGGKLVVCYE